MRCRARILVVGTELLGSKADTNGPLVARELAARGIVVRGISIVPDDVVELAARIREAASEEGLVVVLGGLGPTPDDVTREALSAATGVAMIEDAVARARVDARFALRDRVPNELSLRQVLVPEGSEVVQNVTGSAPGSVLVRGRAVILCLPGPPGELAAMLDDALACALRGLDQLGIAPASAPARGTLVLAGIGESDVAERIGGIEQDGFEIAWLARPGEVRVHFTGDASSVATALAAARVALGEAVVSDDGRSLAEVVVHALASREETIGAAESCTGGLVSGALTSVAGSSVVVRAGIVAYANDAKMSLLGVAPELIEGHGAVSEEVAIAMASGMRRAAQVDWAIGVTGIAGPGGGTAEKPVGLVFIAVISPDGQRIARRFLYGGSRDDIRQATTAALDMIRRAL